MKWPFGQKPAGYEITTGPRSFFSLLASQGTVSYEWSMIQWDQNWQHFFSLGSYCEQVCVLLSFTMTTNRNSVRLSIRWSVVIPVNVWIGTPQLRSYKAVLSEDWKDRLWPIFKHTIGLWATFWLSHWITLAAVVTGGSGDPTQVVIILVAKFNNSWKIPGEPSRVNAIKMESWQGPHFWALSVVVFLAFPP